MNMKDGEIGSGVGTGIGTGIGTEFSQRHNFLPMEELYEGMRNTSAISFSWKQSIYFMMKVYTEYVVLWNIIAVGCAFALLWTLRFDRSFQRACCGRRSEVKQGIYFSLDHDLSRKIVERCQSLNPENRKSLYSPTPYLYSGDWMTLVPFTFFSTPNVRYTRRYLRSMDHEDGESVALDFSFPVQKVQKNGPKWKSQSKSTTTIATTAGAATGNTSAYEPFIDLSKPLVVILHGLNGGSNEGYVVDAVKRANEKGLVTVVMIARGLSGTPIVNSNPFHGGRLTDVQNTIRVLRATLNRCHTGQKDDAGKTKFQPKIGLLGYSVGGIIASNYVASLGKECGVDCAVALSAAFDYRKSIHDKQAQRVWQPLIAYALKSHMVYVQQHWFGNPKLSMIHLDQVEDIKNIQEFDRVVTANIAQESDVNEYYADISCGAKDKIKNLAVPLLMMSAEDDPLISIDTMEGSVQEAVQNKYLIVKITRQGGHVGWPTSWNPLKDRWKYMNETSLDFIETSCQVLEKE